MSSAALAGNISGRAGNISGSPVGADTTTSSTGNISGRSGNISGFTDEVFSTLLGLFTSIIP
jgi:hypothetical protein